MVWKTRVKILDEAYYFRYQNCVQKIYKKQQKSDNYFIQ